MANKIKLTPSELIAQSERLMAIGESYKTSMKEVDGILKNVNANWSKNMANSFECKITQTTTVFTDLINLLEATSNATSRAANSFTTVDQQLKNLILGNDNEIKTGAGADNYSDEVDSGAGPDQVSKDIFNDPKAIADYIHEKYDDSPKSVQALIDAIGRTAIDKDVYDILKIINKLISGNFDYSTFLDGISTIVSISENSSPYTKAVITTFKNLERYMKLTGEIDEKFTEAVLAGRIDDGLKILLKGIIKVPLGGSVDVICQMIGSTSIPGTNINLNSIVGLINVATGVDIGKGFNKFTKSINSIWDKIFG